MVSSVQLSIDVIQEEARRLVKQGILSRQQPIYTLCRYFAAGEWNWLESELERHDFLLRDRIIDLLGREDWEDD